MNTHPSSAIPDPERRRYYRVDDNAMLAYRIIPVDQVERTLARFREGPSDRFSLSATYIGNDTAMKESLAHIKAEQPAVASYLDALDRKMNLLANLVMTMNNDFEDYPSRRVNLSGGGVAFDIEHKVITGTVVEVKLILLPSYRGILAYGTVIHCKGDEQNANDPLFPWRMALNFAHIRETDREHIVRHVLHQQAVWLRHRHFEE
ncbi:putative PilZ domain-containing protein [Gammaproteobacteria bacterium]